MSFIYNEKTYEVYKMARRRIVLITDDGLLIAPYPKLTYKRIKK